MARRLDDCERVEVASEDELRAWLAAHHGQRESVWAVTWRKHVPDRHVPYDAVVCAALAWGWVDSLPRALDGDRTMLLLSPRKAGSGWSRANKARVARLRAEGRMAPPGEAAVARAVADGSWGKLDAVEALEVPEDLAAALAGVPGARVAWDGFPRSARRGILEWIVQAKRAETRAKRVETTARMAGEGRRALFDR